MTLSEVLPFIGCSELNAGLAQLLESGGKKIGSLSRNKLRSQGMEGMAFHAQGLATFDEREDCIDTCAEPKDAGEAILVAAFAYGAGSKTFTPCTGPMPFSTGPIATRHDHFVLHSVQVKVVEPHHDHPG